MRPAALGRRHALHAMHARFELEPREHVAAGDRGDRLLDSRRCRSRDSSMHLELPAVQRGIALIHAEQIGGEQRRLVAAGAGAHFEDGVALVGLVLGQQHELARWRFELGQPFLSSARARLGQRRASRHRRRRIMRVADPRARPRALRNAAMPRPAASGRNIPSTAWRSRCRDSGRDRRACLPSSAWRATSWSSLRDRPRSLTFRLRRSPSRNSRRSSFSDRRGAAIAAARSRSTSDGSCSSRLTRSRVAASASPPGVVERVARAAASKWRAQRRHRRHRAPRRAPPRGTPPAPRRRCASRFARRPRGRRGRRAPRARDRRDRRGTRRRSRRSPGSTSRRHRRHR